MSLRSMTIHDQREAFTAKKGYIWIFAGLNIKADDLVYYTTTTKEKRKRIESDS